MIRTIVRGLAMAALLSACSETTSPNVAPTLRAPASALSSNMASAAAAGQLTQAATGLCLSVANDRNASYVAVQLAPCAGTPGQLWDGGPVGTPAALKVFSGAQCLDDWGAEARAGDRLGTWTCVAGAPTQTWTLTSAGELKMANGLCVQGGTAAGQQATLQTCTGAATQKWASSATSEPAPAPAPTPVLAAGALSQAATGLCLSVANDRNASDVAVLLAPCTGSAGQVWAGAAVGTPAALKVFDGAQCLDDWGAAGRAGDRLGTYRCVPGAPTQTWTLTSAGELKMANGLCVQGGSAGQQVTLQTCTGAANQKWTAGATTEPAPVPAPAPAPAPAPSFTAPELPRITIDTRMPTTTGRVIAVPAGGDLQAALNAAQPGDVVTLANGATYTGNFVLPNKPAGGWIIVRPADMSGLPTEGARIAPSRHAAAMPKLVPPNGSFALATPDAYANTGTRGWRVVGLEIASHPTTTTAQAIVELGTGRESSLSAVASHIVLDRVWIHGRANQSVQRCVTLNSASTAVIDSYLAECHTRGSEGQVIGGWTTPGPVKIENNYLEGGTIGILFGGADPRIQGLIPSDIVVRRNHLFKPLGWRGVWSVKNSFELKNAQRVLVEGNVFENNWVDAQSGYMILFTPLSQDNLAPWTAVRDVTFRQNVLRNSDHGFMIAARTAYGANAVQLTDVTRRVLVEHNVLDQVRGRGFLVTNELQDLTIANNVANGVTFALMLHGDLANAPAARLVLRDNLMSRGTAFIIGDGTGRGSAALSVYAPDAVVAGNVVYNTAVEVLDAISLYPLTNTFVADAGLAGITSASVNGMSILNARLSSTSAYFRSGTGGSTAGADLSIVGTATAGVVQP